MYYPELEKKYTFQDIYEFSYFVLMCNHCRQHTEQVAPQKLDLVMKVVVAVS